MGKKYQITSKQKIKPGNLTTGLNELNVKKVFLKYQLIF